MVLLSFGGNSDSGKQLSTSSSRLSGGSSDEKMPKKISSKGGSKALLGDKPIDHGIDVDKIIHRHAGSHKHTKNAFQYSSHVIQKPNCIAMGDI